MSLLNEVLKDLDSQDAKSPDQELLRQYASPSLSSSATNARARAKQGAVLVLMLLGVVLLGLGLKAWIGGRADPATPVQPVADVAETSVVASKVEESAVSVPRISVASSVAPGGKQSVSAASLKSDADAATTEAGAAAGPDVVALDPVRESVTVKPAVMLPRFSAGEPVVAKPKVSEPRQVVSPVRRASTQTARVVSSSPRVAQTAVSPKPVTAARARPSLQSIQPPQFPAEPARLSVSKPGLKRLYELDLAERAEALRLVAVGDLSGAESRLRRFLTANPEAKLSRSTLASVLIQQNRPIEAEQILIGGMAQDEEGMDRVKLLARTHIARKDYDAAKRILDANPISIDRDPEYHSLRAAVYQRTGDFGAAASTYRQLLNDYPPQPAWWLGLALSLEAVGGRKDAIHAYRQVRDFQGAKPALKAYASERIIAITR